MIHARNIRIGTIIGWAALVAFSMGAYVVCVAVLNTVAAVQ